MIKYIFIIPLSFLLFSCQSENKEEAASSNSTPSAPLTLSDHGLLVCQYVYENGLDSISLEDIQQHFNLPEGHEDTIELDQVSLKRTFYFNEGQLEAIKYATYTDSAGMIKSIQELNALKSDISNLLTASTKDSTLYTNKWEHQGISYQLKIYPEEGIDLIISKSVNSGNTDCVGDLYSAQDYLAGLIQQKLNNSILLDTLNAKTFGGITVNCQEGQIQLIYNCSVSKKLKMLDALSIEKRLNSLFNSKSTVKDGMLFWSYSNGELQLEEMEKGFAFHFIH
ncbi:hypothetical protein [Parvicella tangerina]|uniref:Lipoprotein n=1 Tax=Parvicella tangerina TaxID=2829795 RepID=A0A916JJD5_9FLAO|nr:hypothetical protein [Parvicella tangerina]CAG5076257.1 hypothetical protein CRYO30217_00011 [Parvicella tangerina]